MRRGLFAAALVIASSTVAPQARAALPFVSAVAASEIGSESARLEGLVDPNGLSTSYSFEYVPLASYSETGLATAVVTPAIAIGAGTEAQEASATIGGLTANITYYFRLSATNSSGVTSSNLSNFSTPQGVELGCEGDSCQILPPAPVDPTLTTLLTGLGNPAPHYHRLNHLKKRAKRRKSQARPKRPRKHRGAKVRGGRAR